MPSANTDIAVVVGVIVGYFFQTETYVTSWPAPHSFYTIAVAGLSMLLGLLGLIPLSWKLIHYPTDFVLTICWIVVYALLISFIKPINCGSIWDWSGILTGSLCGKLKLGMDFSFLSCCFWFVSGLIVSFQLLGPALYH